MFVGILSFSKEDGERYGAKFSRLREMLEGAVRSKIGRDSFYMVHGPRREPWLDREVSNFGDSVVIFPVLTEAYLHDVWCHKELAAVNRLHKQGQQTNIFPLLLDSNITLAPFLDAMADLLFVETPGLPLRTISYSGLLDMDKDDVEYLDFINRTAIIVSDYIVSTEHRANKLNAHDLNGLDSRLPSQEPSPISVEIRNSRFCVAPTPPTSSAGDVRLADMHAEMLDAASLAGGRVGANHAQLFHCLQRYTTAMGTTLEELQVIRLGSIGIRLQAEAEAYFEDGRDPLSAEQRGALNALLALHGLFIRLAPEWREFIEEAEAALITPQALADAVDSVAPLATEMEKSPDAFDPEIPTTLRFVADTARKIGGTLKVAGLALVRILGNVLSATGRFLLDMARKTLTKTSDQVSDAVAKSLAVTVSGAIIAAAIPLSSLSQHFPDMFKWLDPLLKVVMQYFGG